MEKNGKNYGKLACVSKNSYLCKLNQIYSKCNVLRWKCYLRDAIKLRMCVQNISHQIPPHLKLLHSQAKGREEKEKRTKQKVSMDPSNVMNVSKRKVNQPN